MINSKWIFKVKCKEDGSIDHFKARLAVNDIRQVKGSDYLDTFSLVIHPLSIRLVLTLAISRGWKMHQVVISNVFLHGNLEERIVIFQSFGFIDQKSPDYV